MRISEAGLASISRVNSNGETEYLTQWSKTWQAYSLIGGHVEAGETFHECYVRDVEEELELQPDVEARVQDEPLSPVMECEAIFKAAGVLTRYRIELTETWLLDNEAALKVVDTPESGWLTPSKILNKTSGFGRAVADPVGHALRHLEQLRRRFQ